MDVVVKHKLESANYEIENNYSTLLGKEWAKQLRPFLNEDYMTNLVYFLDQVYKQREESNSAIITPRYLRDVFAPWIKTDFNNVRVVIVTEEPVSLASNGLGYGTYCSVQSPIRCEKQQAMVKNLKKNAIMDERTFFDKSLETWSEQGVMMLNVGMVKQLGVSKKYYDVFKELVRATLTALSDVRMDLIFCFMSEQLGKDFAHCLDNDQMTLLYKNWDENTEIFEDINSSLKYLKEHEIEW